MHNKIILVSLIIFSVGAVLILSIDSCGLLHIRINDDLRLYEQNMDPEFCEELVDKIITFNEQCIHYVEILDCG